MMGAAPSECWGIIPPKVRLDAKEWRCEALSGTGRLACCCAVDHYAADPLGGLLVAICVVTAFEGVRG